jgi:hypothetical protein
MAYWDKETEVGEVPKNKIEKQKLSTTELKGKNYISITTIKQVGDEWKPIGGTSIVITDELRSLWPQLTAAVMGIQEEVKEQL